MTKLLKNLTFFFTTSNDLSGGRQKQQGNYPLCSSSLAPPARCRGAKKISLIPVAGPPIFFCSSFNFSFNFINGVSLFFVLQSAGVLKMRQLLPLTSYLTMMETLKNNKKLSLIRMPTFFLFQVLLSYKKEQVEHLGNHG